MTYVPQNLNTDVMPTEHGLLWVTCCRADITPSSQLPHVYTVLGKITLSPAFCFRANTAPSSLRRPPVLDGFVCFIKYSCMLAWSGYLGHHQLYDFHLLKRCLVETKVYARLVRLLRRRGRGRRAGKCCGQGGEGQGGKTRSGAAGGCG